MNHIPFTGAAEVPPAIASKHIAVAAMNIGEAVQVTGGERAKSLTSARGVKYA